MIEAWMAAPVMFLSHDRSGLAVHCSYLMVPQTTVDHHKLCSQLAASQLDAEAWM